MCRCRRVKPSTPLADAPIVVLSSTLTKQEMHDALEQAFSENGISSSHTRIGYDVVCRIGDPTTPQDLQRVGAHRARAILLQMTVRDVQEFEAEEGGVQNGATLRTLLALRVLLGNCCNASQLEDMRVVAQMGRPSKAIDVIDLGTTADGFDIFRPVDLSEFLNGLMFGCLSQPGLAYALKGLLGFEGVALRSQQVKNFSGSAQYLVGKRVQDLHSVFEDGIFVGLVTAKTGTACLLPPPGQVLEPEDRIVFVSARSIPTIAILPAQEQEDRIGFVSARSMPTIAKLPAQEQAHPSSPSSPKKIKRTLVKQQVLVCGWRDEWDDPARFARRVQQTAAEMAAGSGLTFLCMKGAEDQKEDFAQFMSRAGKTSEARGNLSKMKDHQNVWSLTNGVTLTHVLGNAADYHSLEDVMKNNTFNQAVVISTIANKTLSPQMRDTRMMSILVTLRHLQCILDQPAIKIIGENALAGTSILAIGPTLGESAMTKIPDFVSVHAIYASAVVQALAYPRMFDCVSELFRTSKDSAGLGMFKVEDFIELGTYPFSVLMRTVRCRQPGDILVGIRKVAGGMVLAPELAEDTEVRAGDFLMILTRQREDSRSLRRAGLNGDDVAVFKHPGGTILAPDDDDGTLLPGSILAWC
mmetsp:Transcript_24069/g.81273  ORF Transcript_24069/g.81273 Transcript_24069/m.81273 type:complete len:639 (+) Transcript_24069:258-2174(+)